jgi:uncharacterized LabA/DUF88 family protein
LKKLIAFLEQLVRHAFDKIIFVSAEDFNSMLKNESLYVKMKKIGIELDIRDFKQKSSNCTNCKSQIKQKVQAEVDVSIAVKLIDYASLPSVKSVTLLAGDRDFYDAIKYVEQVMAKPINLIAFKGNMSNRLPLHCTEVFILNQYWDTLCNFKPSVLTTDNSAKKK